MLVLQMWREQPGEYFCISTKSGSGKWRDTFFTRKQFVDVEEFIRDNKDKDIYFCCHGFSKASRVKDCAVIPKLLWADMDEADPRKIKLRPTVAIESSPDRFVAFWKIDKPMTEDVNRRLSYMVGADKSGWDLGQVLRVPGTRNYKYEANPRVKLLWDDGPEYKLGDIVERLPVANGHAGGADRESNAAEIFKRYQNKIPGWVRQELMSGKPRKGNRSDMVWKLEHTLLEKGLSTDEAFVLIKASPWNKFKGRRNEDEQLKRELDKAINQHLDAEAVADSDELLIQSIEEVMEEDLRWLYYPYLALGELSMLEGDPGLGKSYLAQMIGASIVEGKRLPAVDRRKIIKGPVLYFDFENSAGSVTKKRLRWNGFTGQKDFHVCADILSINEEENKEKVFRALERIKPVLTVFDPINSYIGSADAYKAHEAQQAFGHFRDIATRFDTAVLAIRHLTKSTKEKALYRGQGSIAFAGLSRVVMTVGQHPEDPETRVMAVTKLNVTHRPQALEFMVTSRPGLKPADLDRSKFEFGDFVDLDADEILQAPKASTEREDAEDILKEILHEGPVEFGKLEKMAEARSISRRTLYRAGNQLGVLKESKGFGSDKKSFWSLGT